MGAKTGCPFKNESGVGAAVIEVGTVVPVPKPPDIGPFVRKGPKADLPEPEAAEAKELREGGKIPAVAESPLPSGPSTEPLGAIMPKVLVPDVVPDVKLPDCPERPAVFKAEFVGVAVLVSGCVGVPCPGEVYGAPFV